MLPIVTSIKTLILFRIFGQEVKKKIASAVDWVDALL
jgi:hypothetical protein